MADTVNRAHTDLLAKVDLFARLDRVALAQLAAFIEPVGIEDGADVCRQGDPADSLYIVSGGTFGVYAAPSGSHHETRLGTLSVGDYFGEMGLLTGDSRSATVRAEGAGEVLRLDRERFLALTRREPEVGVTLAATLSRRLRAADHTIHQSDEFIARTVERVLSRIDPARYRQVLEASVLEDASESAYRALFGDDAEHLAEHLNALGVRPGQPATPLREALRRRFEREVGTERARAFAREVADRLLDRGCWEEALRILARHGPRAALVAALGRALSGARPLHPEAARRWLGRITDQEAARDADCALARAALHRERGDDAAAARVLRAALANGSIARDGSKAGRLTAAVAELATASRALGGTGRGYEVEVAEARERRPLPRAPLVAVPAAAGLVVAAAAAGGRDPLVPFLLLTAAASILWTSGVFPDFAVGIGLVAAWVLFGIARPADAAAGFASLDWIFVVAVFGIAAGIARSGLLFRVGLLVVRRLPRGLFWQAGTLLLTGLLLSPLLPSNFGRLALTIPLALAVAEALRLDDRDPAAAVLGQAAWIGAGGPLMFIFLNASPLCLLAWGLLPDEGRQQFDWLHWFVAAAPLAAFVAVASLAALFPVLRPGAARALPQQRVATQLAVLGPLTRRESAMIAVLGLTIVGWILGPALRLDIGTVAVGGLLGAVLTGNFDRRALQELDWNYLIFYGVAISIARLGATLGLDRAAAETVGPAVAQAGADPLLFLLGLACLIFLVRLVLPQNQTILLLGLAFIPAAPAAGVHPWLVVLTLLATSSLWVLPTQTPMYVFAASVSEGRLFSHAQARRFALVYAGITLVGLVLSTPYWRLLGLL